MSSSRSPSSCRICGATPLAEFTRRDARYGRCPSCGALLKLLSPEEYQALHIDYHADALQSLDVATLRRVLEIDEKRAFLRPLLERHPNKGTFLDIGCGQGGYLLAARELGWDVLGVEPSPSHSATGREHFELRIEPGYFDATRYGDRRFECVLLSHVIEHMYDPNAFLESVLSVVAPGGSLLVVTPNAAANVARWTGRYWTMLKQLDHVSMLTQEAFERMPALSRMECRFQELETKSEALASLLASARDAARELRVGNRAAGDRAAGDRAAGDRAASGAIGDTELRRHRLRRVHAALAVIGAPFHHLNVKTRRQGCLFVEVVRPAGGASRLG